MAYVGQFQTGAILYASEVNSLFAACVMTTTTVQAVATATATTVSFANADEVRDPLGWHSDASFPPRIYPTITGLYLVDGSIQFAANSGTGAYLTLTKNNVEVAKSAGDLSGAGANASLSLSHMMEIANGDHIYLACYQNSGGSVNITLKTFSAVLLAV